MVLGARMEKEMNRPEDKDRRRELENARVGYQVAASLATDYSGGVWPIFNAMLVANSIVFAVVFTALTRKPPGAPWAVPLSLVAVVLSTAGLILCFLWLLLIRRPQEMAIYYMQSACQLEEKYLAADVKTISHGRALADNDLGALSGVPEEERPRPLSALARVMRGRWASLAVTCLFAALYFMTLLCGLITGICGLLIWFRNLA